MQITLNEYTLAILCGGISYLTYFLTNTLAPGAGKSVRIQDDAKPKSRKTILKSSNSEANDSNVDDDEEEDEADMDEQMSRSEKFQNRRQSYNRIKQQRANSLKSDHVIFADEITADDEKFSPAHDEIPDEMIEGILSRSEDEIPNTVNFNVTEVEELNHFDEIHPLDDHDLMLRRRSLHSTPSGSHRGSKTNLASDLEHDEDNNKSESEGKLKAEVSSCKERICVLENELSDIEATFAHEKHEIEDILEKAGLDKTDLSGSVKDLHLLLQTALARLYPQWPKEGLSENEDLLEKYVVRHSVQDGVPQHQ